MITKTVFIDAFNFIGVNKIEAIDSSHKMAKNRNRVPFKLNKPRALMWMLIVLTGIGFAYLWYLLIAKIIEMFIQ
jgi:hypothetical protein